MLYLNILICFLLSSVAIAESTLDIELNPKEPVLEEPFKVNFVIHSKNGDNPIINFETTSGLEVISRGNSQVSTRTSFVNGKMTHERKVVVSYDVVASKVGISFIKNIKASMGSENFKHNNLSVKVLKVPRSAVSLFVRAEVAKDQYYVGEAILVRYYLYNKSNISMSGTDLKKFPRLDKFLKRYHQENPTPERIQIGNNLFERRVIYTAQLFGEKPGQYKIDPISLSARYSERRSDPFGGLGFGGLRLGRGKTKTLRSKYINLDILPLPEEGKPSDFTGLVGKHDFKLTYNKTKYLSNEPIELQLIVTGPGALELFEAPKIFKNKEIEEFETSADLKINQDFSATKDFEYTYLGRKSVTIPKRVLSFSFFDPASKTYQTKDIVVETFEVVAVGNSVEVDSEDINPRIDKKLSNSENEISYKLKDTSLIMEPVFKAMNTFVYYSKHLIIILGILTALLLFGFIFKIVTKKEKKIIDLFEKIRRDGLSYKKLILLFDQISYGENLESKIKNSSLSHKTQIYFLELQEKMSLDYKKKSNSKNESIKLKSVYLKDIGKKLRSKK